MANFILPIHHNGEHIMKKFLSAIICLLMVIQIVGVMAVPAAAGATGNSLYNSSKVWVVEYDSKNVEGDYGYRTSTSPSLKDGVLAFERGDGIRLNWANIEGFGSFDANKTYTFTFDVKVTDFGQDVPFEASAAALSASPQLLSPRFSAWE